MIGPAVRIETTPPPGALRRCVALHANHYARAAGFGPAFEEIVASGLAGFAERLDASCNGMWFALDGDVLIGTVAIDGQDLGPGRAHLRWFIVDGAARGGGIGRRLLSRALTFCDAHGFEETHLWTFRGLDAARRLYEQAGFALAEERPGRQWGTEVLEQRFVRPRGSPAVQA